MNDTDDGEESLSLDGLQQIRNGRIAAKEERRIFLSEIQEPAIGTDRGMSDQDVLRQIWSRAEYASRFCHGPISPGPMHTATARHEAKVLSSACGHGWPGTRYQRSKN